ncbi:flagella synthesis protein FlgN [Pusillimonas sp. ANT_WB101]|uniref:flagella synthesis protein FlgN n=1 Tax=Pusillimonas sp. ANT_WB101 TaxID=2597356 RepID=UPI00165E10E0|nr:flagellar protein FlgN [Pusillimonas sp. ANT_WB101]
MPAPIADLLNIIQSEIRLFRDFALTLEREARLLYEHTDDDRLAENTTIKTCQAEQLAELAKRRLNALTSMGYTPDHNGLDAAAKQHLALQPLHNELSRLAARAFELNTANGITLDTFIKHNRQTLNELQKLAGHGELYDEGGRSTSRTSRLRTPIRAG